MTVSDRIMLSDGTQTGTQERGAVFGPSDDLQNTILRVALSLFQEHGYHATSIAQIVERARCSKGGFYHHYASKEDLLFIAHDIFISYELSHVEAIVKMERSASARLRLIIHSLVESIIRYRPHVKTFFEDRRFLGDQRMADIRRQRRLLEELVSGVICEGQESEELKSGVDVKIATFALFGMCNWTYQWLIPDGRLSVEVVSDHLAELFLAGLKR